MKNRGYALSAIVYPLLLVCLSLILSILFNMESKRNLLDTLKTKSDEYCEYEIGQSWNYVYTGSEQEFNVPCKGTYKIELWGAQGGNSGGNGAYTSGSIRLLNQSKIYIQVGGQGGKTPAGVAQTVSGGYNGGGLTNGQDCCNRVYGTGGGSTDIRLVSGLWNNTASLASRIMVAAGGGGRFSDSNDNSFFAGVGGTIHGLDASGLYNNYCLGLGATQTSGGKISTVGEHCTSSDIDYTGAGLTTGGFGYGGQHGTQGNNGTGGGGGYYGGSSSGHIASAGGGSSYISGYQGCVAINSSSDISPRKDSNGNICSDGTTDISCSYHYSGYIFTDTKMIAGNESMPTYDGKGNMTGNTGSGYAKITFISL